MRALVILSAVVLSNVALAEGSANPAKGKALFSQNCVVCHGPEGKGDGPAAVGLNPKPANFRDPERQKVMTPEKQLRVVMLGGPAEKLSNQMPSFGEAFTEEQLRNVIAYVNTAFAAPADKATPSPK